MPLNPSTADKIIAEAAAGAEKRLKLLRKREKERRDLTYDQVFQFELGSKSLTGVRVTEEKALQTVAIYACVSYIADYVAALPKITYQRLQKGRKRAIDHWLYPIAHDQPNPYMNDYEFTETLTGHVLLWGNAYAEIVRNGAGEVVELWPLRPDRVQPFLSDGKIFYRVFLPTGGEQILDFSRVFHLKGLACDGLWGYSPIQLHKETIGLAFAEQEYRSRFFSNNASPGGVLEHPGTLSEGAQKRLKKGWEEAHGGLSNAHRVAILEEGTKWQQVGIPAKDLEFIDGQKFTKAQIATIYRVKPSKIGIFEAGTVSYASIEAQQLDTHIDTMRPWVIRWEKKFTSLLSISDRKQFYCEFLFDALLRADSKSRAETLDIWRRNGLINANMWLEIENRNELPDGKGEDFWMPANMMVVGKENNQPDLFVPMTNGNGTTNGKATTA